MHRWLYIAILFFSIFSGIALASCGEASPAGYLSQTATSIMFIQFTATGQNQQQLNGNITDVEENTSDNPPEIKTSTTAFTGVENGSTLTLTISFFGISSSYTGTLNGNTLILDLPQSDGSIQAREFVASSLQQYNQAVAALQKQVADQVQQYNNTQATATAAQSTAAAQQQEQQAVQDANQRLANDLSSLQQDSNTLAQFSESNTLQGYAKDWQQMQKDYATEQQQAQQGCGPSNSNQNQVSADTNQVDADDNQISADDNQFSVDKTQYDLETSAVRLTCKTSRTTGRNCNKRWLTIQVGRQEQPILQATYNLRSVRAKRQ